MKRSTTGFIVFGVILLLLVVFGVSFFEAIWSFPTFSPIPLMVIALVGTGIFVTFWLVSAAQRNSISSVSDAIYLYILCISG